MDIRIEILVTEDCPNQDAAINILVMAAQLLGIRPPVYVLDVTDHAHAKQLRFVGSPTIRVNGQDVAPPSPGQQSPSLSCRLYETSRGLSWVPDFKAVYAALLEATSREVQASRIDPMAPANDQRDMLGVDRVRQSRPDLCCLGLRHRRR